MDPKDIQWVDVGTPRERYERQVTLRDGRVVGSWSDEWRKECNDRADEARVEREAQYVASLPTKEKRHGYILGVSAKRGYEAADKLEKRAREIFKQAIAERKAMQEWHG